jgi:hypothetical protein
MAEWLGHHDFCSLQWSSACDCLTAEQERELCTCPTGQPDLCVLHGTNGLYTKEET